MAVKKKVASKKKVTIKKVVVKKTVTKKVVKKKSNPKKVKMTAIQKRMTKSEIITEISTNTQLSKKNIANILTELDVLIERHIKKRACGEFLLPGLLKITTMKKAAVPAREGINPFTNEPTTFRAKKASMAIKIKPLKKLKEMAN
jgi:nucleoid DNA-binding protein